MLKYEVLEESIIDPDIQWKRAKYDMHLECTNLYRSIVMAKIEGRLFDEKRILSKVVHMGWKAEITDDVVMQTVKRKIYETSRSVASKDECLTHYLGSGVAGFKHSQRKCEGLVALGVDDADIDEYIGYSDYEVDKTLSTMESEIEAIIKEVVDYRQGHCINSAIEIETLVKYVRAQLLIRRGKHVMEVNDLLDLDVLTKIIDKIIGGYPQVKFVSNVPQASI